MNKYKDNLERDLHETVDMLQTLFPKANQVIHKFHSEHDPTKSALTIQNWCYSNPKAAAAVASDIQAFENQISKLKKAFKAYTTVWEAIDKYVTEDRYGIVKPASREQCKTFLDAMVGKQIQKRHSHTHLEAILGMSNIPHSDDAADYATGNAFKLKQMAHYLGSLSKGMFEIALGIETVAATGYKKTEATDIFTNPSKEAK
jgi:hypothetical protein